MKKVILCIIGAILGLLPVLGVAQTCPDPRTIGGEVRISNNDSYDSSLAWNGSEFGVAWMGSSYIYFARISANGVKKGYDTKISSSGGSYPRLIWTGSEFAVGFRSTRNGRRDDIYFARISPLGVKIGSDIKVNDAAAGGSHWFSIVWTGSEYGISWDDTRDGASPEIYFARLSPDGLKIGNDVRITNDPSESKEPAMAWNGSEYGLVWSDYRGEVYQIYFTRISADGLKIIDDLQLTDNPSTVVTELPSLVWNGSEYGLSYYSGTGTSGDGTWFVRLTAAGAKIGNDTRVTPLADIGYPPATLLWIGSEYGLSWHSDDSYVDVLFTRVSADGQKLGTDLRVTGQYINLDPSLAWTGSEFGVTWSDTRVPGHWTIFFTRIGEGEPPLPPTEFHASVIEGTNQIRLDWLVSPSPDVDGYDLYMGGSPATIDYNAIYAAVNHPDNSYTTGDLVPGEQYCFALRAYDLMGNEDQGPGLIACATIPAAPCAVGARIKVPLPGHRYGGNRGLVMADIIGDQSLVRNVLFQVRPVGSQSWSDLVAANACHPNPDADFPYFIHMDLTGADDGEYELRAVTTDIYGCVDPAPESVVITIDQDNCSEWEGDCDGHACKKVKVYSTAPSLTMVADPAAGDRISAVYLPVGSIEDGTTLTLQITADCRPFSQGEDQGIGECRMAELASGQRWLNTNATIAVSYEDRDNDGTVDGTSIDAAKLALYSQDPDTAEWDQLGGFSDPDQRLVVAGAAHFSSFQLGLKTPPPPPKITCGIITRGPQNREGVISMAIALFIPLLFWAGIRVARK